MTADVSPRLETFASLEALPPDADALFATAPDIFSTRAWWRTVLADAMPGGTQPCFVLCRLGERAAALIPLRRSAARSSIDSLTTPYTCHYAPLLHPSLSAAERFAVFAAFGGFFRKWPTTRLDALAEDWPALAECVAGARSAGLAVLRFDHFGNWHEPVAGLDWPAYLARRPGALRETIRRRLRRSERNPGTRFSVVTGGAELESGIAAFEAVYAKSWKDPEPFPRFNAGLMHEAAAQNMLRLGLLYAGQHPVAAQFWIVERATATVLKLAHDEAFKDESPGTVLTAQMLRWLLDDEHVAEIDFGRGDDAYKQGWARLRRQRIGLVLVNPRRIGGVVFLAMHAAGRIQARLKRGQA